MRQSTRFARVPFKRRSKAGERWADRHSEDGASKMLVFRDPERSVLIAREHRKHEKPPFAGRQGRMSIGPCSARGRTAPWALAAMLLLAAAPAHARDDRPHWYGVDDGDVRRLVYGVPDSDHASLAFLCDKSGTDKGLAELSVYLTLPPLPAKAGDILPVRLSDGRTTVDFPATVQAQEMDDLLHVAGLVRLDAPLESLFASQGSLTIRVGKVSDHYPLAGIAAAARPVIALCGTAARAAPAADLVVRVINKARHRLEQLAIQPEDSIEQNSDYFGYDGLAPGKERSFTIPGGRDVCTYRVFVILAAEDEEDCCSMGDEIAFTNLCDDPRIIVRD